MMDTSTLNSDSELPLSNSLHSMQANVTLKSPNLYQQSHHHISNPPIYYNHPSFRIHKSNDMYYTVDTEQSTVESLLIPTNEYPLHPFDPHIDGFEIVRAKVTGITRTMQQYHVDELLMDDQVSIETPVSSISLLCSTTNTLIHNRMIEETGIYHSDQSDTLSSTDEMWRDDFLDLTSRMIQYSEQLESISTEILRAEGRVRELMVLQNSILEQYEEREKAYLDRLHECEQVSQRQLDLIDHLIELDKDLDIPYQKQSRRHIPTSTSSASLSTIYGWHSSEQGQARSPDRSNVHSKQQQSPYNIELKDQIKDIVQIQTMEDMVHYLRWEIALWVGGSIGNGHVVHSFEGPLNGLEMIIAGSGTLTSPILKESYIQSPSLKHIKFHRHHYLLHVNKKDRQTRFNLLPKNAWVPDNAVSQCQFKTYHSQCSTRFSFFNRRHHCRR
ncbi:hypothetical protein BDB01DRAFT_799838 [Pilobolus umbonatus]|nr:hypothetical protein BDB01DRAFT_799838 [Pilobolus umbonatus]